MHNTTMRLSPAVLGVVVLGEVFTSWTAAIGNRGERASQEHLIPVPAEQRLAGIAHFAA